VSVTLKLTATLTTDGAPLSGKTVSFYYSYDGSTWTLIGSATTDANGQASVTHTTDRTTYYKAEFPGDPEYEPSSATATYTPPGQPTQPPTGAVAPAGILIWIILLILLLLLGVVALTEERRQA
jgi:hypothetical protein